MKNRENILRDVLIELIRRASCDLPVDVEKALENALQNEEGNAKEVISTILINARLARKESFPICQDTGLHSWTVYHPAAIERGKLHKAIIKATSRATVLGYLRPNTVEPVSGKNTGNNIGDFHPVIGFVPWKKNFLCIELLLKGGGCENVSCQISLPDPSIGAGRDLDGVRKAVLKMIHQAQGKGCSPGVAGICIGGDRLAGYKIAKDQLKRQLSDRNKNKILDKLEKEIMEEANSLNIGPMGFGGATTLLGVKIGLAARHPASFFVTMSYSCWALRRCRVRVNKNGTGPVFTQKLEV